MTNLLASGNANNFNNPVTALLNGVKKGLLFAFGFALVLTAIPNSKSSK